MRGAASRADAAARLSWPRQRLLGSSLARPLCWPWLPALLCHVVGPLLPRLPLGQQPLLQWAQAVERGPTETIKTGGTHETSAPCPWLHTQPDAPRGALSALVPAAPSRTPCLAFGPASVRAGCSSARARRTACLQLVAPGCGHTALASVHMHPLTSSPGGRLNLDATGSPDSS